MFPEITADNWWDISPRRFLSYLLLFVFATAVAYGLDDRNVGLVLIAFGISSIGLLAAGIDAEEQSSDRTCALTLRLMRFCLVSAAVVAAYRLFIEWLSS